MEEIKHSDYFSVVRSLPLGKAAEHLVCADLLLSGLDAFIVSDPTSPYDILIRYNGKFIKVQVKSIFKEKIIYSKDREMAMPTYAFKTGVKGWKGKKRQDVNDIDICALVVLKTKEISYLPFSECRKTVSFRIPSMRGFYFNERMASLSNIIKELFDDGLTTEEIGKFLGISPSSIYRNRGENYRKRGENIGKYFDVFTLDSCLKKINK